MVWRRGMGGSAVSRAVLHRGKPKLPPKEERGETWIVSCPICRLPFSRPGPPSEVQCVTCGCLLMWERQKGVRPPKQNNGGSRPAKRHKPAPALSESFPHINPKPYQHKPPKPPGKKRGGKRNPSSKPDRKRVWEKMQAERLKYMASKEWQAVRRRKFEQVGRACEKCQATGIVHVHHLTYANLFHEHLDDLQVLCESCHEEAHGRKFDR